MRLIEHKLNKYFSTKWQKYTTKINIELNDKAGKVKIPGNEVLKNQEKVKKKKGKKQRQRKGKKGGGRRERNW